MEQKLQILRSADDAVMTFFFLIAYLSFNGGGFLRYEKRDFLRLLLALFGYLSTLPKSTSHFL